MPFHFTLDGLWRVRQGLERRQELLLLEANLRVAAVQKQIDALDLSAEQARRHLAEQIALGLNASELQFHLLCRAVLLERRDVLTRELNQVRAVRESRAVAFREARRQREALDTIHQQQLQSYLQQELRREQRRLDDMFLLRRAYRNRG